MFHPMKAETIRRKKIQYAKEHQENILRLYEENIEAAEKNKDNPTGQDYKDAAERIKNKWFYYFQ